MPDPPTWPPPPNTPNPLSAHDDFLVACVRNSTLKVPLSRLSLARGLRQETEMELYSCWAFVNNFCDRHTILTPSSWWGIDLLIAPITLAAVVAMGSIIFLLQQRRDAATANMVKLAIKAEQNDLYLIAVGIMVAGVTSIIILSVRRDKKMAEQTVEAKEKFA